jgi:hypothetical protein
VISLAPECKGGSDGIGFGGVFSYMGHAIIPMRYTKRHGLHGRDEFSQFPNDERERAAIRKDPP